MIARALLRFIARTRWSSGMAVVGMMLGITSIVAVHLVSVQVADRLDALIPPPLSNFDYLAHKDHLTSTDFFDLSRLQASQPSSIEQLVPIIDETLILDEKRVRLVGIDFLQFAPDELGEETGRDLSARDLFAGVFVGEGVELDRPVLGRLAAPGVIVADIGVAQELLGWEESDRLSYIGIRAANVVGTGLTWLNKFFPGAAAGIPAAQGPKLVGYRVQVTSEQHPAKNFGDAVLFNISALGGLALVVAWFLIYQVAVFWVRRLQGVFDRLFILGVDHGVLLFYFIGLLVTVGMAASAGGLFLGWLLAGELLSASVSEDLSVTLDVWIVSKALFSALLVCVVGGAWAFNQVLPQSQLTIPTALRIALVMVVVALIALGLLVTATDLLGGFTSIALLSVLLVYFITPVLQVIKRWSRLLRGSFLLRMSIREVIWFPRDLSVALAGLSLAIASAIGVGLMVDSFRTEFKSMLDQRLNYDYVVAGPETELKRLHQTMGDDPRVIRSQLYREQNVRLLDSPVSLVIAELDEAEAARYGYSARVDSSEVLVSEQVAGLLNRTVGDSIELSGATLQIVHVFKSFGDLVPTLLRNPKPTKEDAPLVSVRVNTSVQAAAEYADAFPATEWRDQRLLYEAALRTFDQTFVITSILVGIAIGVGGIGVYVAVTVLRLNQRASERLLDFMGLARVEILGIDLARGAGVGVIACAFAVPLGLAFGWILCSVINPRAFGWFIDLQITAGAIAIPVFWGMLAAIIAGLTRVGQQEAGFDG